MGDIIHFLCRMQLKIDLVLLLLFVIVRRLWYWAYVEVNRVCHFFWLYDVVSMYLWEYQASEGLNSTRDQCNRRDRCINVDIYQAYYTDLLLRILSNINRNNITKTKEVRHTSGSNPYVALVPEGTREITSSNKSTFKRIRHRKWIISPIAAYGQSVLTHDLFPVKLTAQARLPRYFVPKNHARVYVEK